MEVLNRIAELVMSLLPPNSLLESSPLPVSANETVPSYYWRLVRGGGRRGHPGLYRHNVLPDLRLAVHGDRVLLLFLSHPDSRVSRKFWVVRLSDAEHERQLADLIDQYLVRPDPLEERQSAGGTAVNDPMLEQAVLADLKDRLPAGWRLLPRPGGYALYRYPKPAVACVALAGTTLVVTDLRLSDPDWDPQGLYDERRSWTYDLAEPGSLPAVLERLRELDAPMTAAGTDGE